MGARFSEGGSYRRRCNRASVTLVCVLSTQTTATNASERYNDLQA